MSNIDPRPAEHGFWWKLWQVLKVVQARLRFVAILVAVGALIGFWDTINNYYEKWTRPLYGTHEAAEELFWQSVLEKIYLAHLNVPFLFLGHASERGHKSVVDLELHDDLARAPMHGHYLAEFWIEIILQHHWPWLFKEKIGSVRDGSAGQNTQFFAIGNMLHDARHPGDAQLAEGARAMAAVV